MEQYNISLLFNINLDKNNNFIENILANLEKCKQIFILFRNQGTHYLSRLDTEGIEMSLIISTLKSIACSLNFDLNEMESH